MSAAKSESFFLDVFNKLLKINDESIMIIFDVDGNIWFKFRDLLKALGYTSLTKQFNLSTINKIYLNKFNKIKVPQSNGVPPNFQKNTVFINEPGLYELLAVSTKPLAKVFMKKYYTEIM